MGLCVEISTLLGAKYMGADRAEEFGRRNGVPGELVVRVRPTHVYGSPGRGGLMGRACHDPAPPRLTLPGGAA